MRTRELQAKGYLQYVQLHTCDMGNGWLYSHSWAVSGSPNVSGVGGEGSYPFPTPGRFLAYSEDEALREAASDALDSLIEKTVGFPRSMRTWLEGYCGARVTSDTYQPALFGAPA